MKKAIIGYGGHAREVMAQISHKMPCFVDDKYVNQDTLPISKFDPTKYEVMVCVGNSKLRMEFVDKLPKLTKYFTFIHPMAIIGRDVLIGDGSFIGAYSMITTNIKVGKHAILNRHCQIGHDTQAGDYLSMMPNSVISGNCNIGDQVYFGTNSSVREKISICDDVIIGLNAGVVKNIIEPGTYVGVPAKKIK